MTPLVLLKLSAVALVAGFVIRNYYNIPLETGLERVSMTFFPENRYRINCSCCGIHLDFKS